MSNANPSSPSHEHAHPSVRALVTAVFVGSIAALTANIAIGAIARAVGASSDFGPLTPTELVVPTIFGALVGGVGWWVIARRSTRPWAIFRAVAPVVVVISLVPDVILWTDGTEQGTSPGAVAALMTTHVATAVVLVAAFQWLMPVDRSRQTVADVH